MTQISTIPQVSFSGKPPLYKSGDRYGRLMLTGKSYLRNKSRYVEYICECSKIGCAILYGIRNGSTTSCGCRHKEIVTTHGMSRIGDRGNKHPLYSAWVSMKQRCYNAKNKYYHNYGGRGIGVCDEWRYNFEPFKTWALENGWVKGLTIDRKENNGDYEPSNCRWVKNSIQSRNKRTTIYLEAFGEKKCVADWILDNRCSINYNSVVKRIKNGWSVEDAISKPSTTYNKNYSYK